MKKIAIIIILSAELFGCSMAEKVQIIGTAQDAKAGAVVLTNSNIFLYIDNKDRWPQDYINKKVEVRGRLVAKIDTSINENSVSQNVEIMLLIKRPKIKMINMK
jgi:hypothetical protein